MVERARVLSEPVSLASQNMRLRPQVYKSGKMEETNEGLGLGSKIRWVKAHTYRGTGQESHKQAFMGTIWKTLGEHFLSTCLSGVANYFKLGSTCHNFGHPADGNSSINDNTLHIQPGRKSCTA